MEKSHPFVSGCLSGFLIIQLFTIVSFAQQSPAPCIYHIPDPLITAQQIVDLTFIDPGVTPFSGYRWRDVAGNLYADSYRQNYSYADTDVQVHVTFEESAAILYGQVSAVNLKPNFAYQLKLNGIPGTDANERIGLCGRWWQEEWDGSQWSNGQNLNNKGDGSSPNPNDLVYLSRREVTDPTSPTGLHYRFTGYLLCDYFVTDTEGSAVVDFEVNSSYHVLWNTLQRTPASGDGPLKTAVFDPDPAQEAYDADYPDTTMTMFGEWERLPWGEIFLALGDYNCQIILTEESFHGWPGGSYTGQWAAAMGGDIQFTIEEDNPLFVTLSSFTAEPGDSCVCLRWTTESEIDHAGFELLRSTEKSAGYYTISDYRDNPDLNGQGNSSVRREYVYIDSDVHGGNTYWYYLVDVGLDGKRTNHGPLSVFLSGQMESDRGFPVSPVGLILYPNYPNPFNPATVINYQLPITNYIELSIYNTLGQKVITLISDAQDAGNHQVVWQGIDDQGNRIVSGVYICRITAAGQSRTIKMLLLR